MDMFCAVDDAVANITDVHGNLLALEAVPARIGETGLRRIFCGEDLDT